MRGKQSPKRTVSPDPRYGSVIIERLVRQIMRRGKKSVAQRIVYDAFTQVEKAAKKEPMDVFDQAMKNVSPSVEVRSRRIGGANYQIPTEVRGERRMTLGLRWLVQAARDRHGMSMEKKLAEEILNAAKNEGAAVKKKEDVHRMAEANRAFAHFAAR